MQIEDLRHFLGDVAKGLDQYSKDWPNYCRNCLGRGFVDQWIEQTQENNPEPCSHCMGLCPQCSRPKTTADCFACGWNWRTGGFRSGLVK